MIVVVVLGRLLVVVAVGCCYCCSRQLSLLLLLVVIAVVAVVIIVVSWVSLGPLTRDPNLTATYLGRSGFIFWHIPACSQQIWYPSWVFSLSWWFSSHGDCLLELAVAFLDLLVVTCGPKVIFLGSGCRRSCWLLA